MTNRIALGLGAAIQLGAITTTANTTLDGTSGAGDLLVIAGGDITDTPGSAIIVPGRTSLIATDGADERYDIKLDNSLTGQHDFNSDDVFSGVAVNDPSAASGTSPLQFDGD